MQNLLAFLARYYHWILFLILEVISAVMLFRHNSYQSSVWVSSANSVAGKVYEISSSVEQFFTLTKRAEQLTRRNVQLEAEMAQMRTALTELQHDSTTVDSSIAVQMSTLRYVPAKVVSNQVDRTDNLMTINRGSADGIMPDMGVVSGQGIVGVTYMVGPHYTVVMPVLNSHSRISCIIRQRGYFGYLTWDGRSASQAYMDDVPRHAQFEVGDWVETSGFSTIFPQGFTVGRITSVGNSADGLSYRLTIDLSTDFGRLRDVCVLNDTTIAERARLELAARDSLNRN